MLEIWPLVGLARSCAQLALNFGHPAVRRFNLFELLKLLYFTSHFKNGHHVVLILLLLRIFLLPLILAVHQGRISWLPTPGDVNTFKSSFNNILDILELSKIIRVQNYVWIYWLLAIFLQNWNAQIDHLFEFK